MSDSTSPKPCAKFRKLFCAALLIVVIVLAATGIGTFLIGQAPMTHWVLMLHVGAAPVFALGLAAMSLTCAGRCGAQSSDSARSGAASPSCASKALFWLVLLCGLVVILSGVVPMTPLFGTAGQHLLYLTHRYSAMVLVLLAVLHGLSLRGKCR